MKKRDYPDGCTLPEIEKMLYIANHDFSAIRHEPWAVLRAVIYERKPFDTGWMNVRHSTHHARVQGDGKYMKITVCGSIDEFPALLDDAADDVKLGRDLTDDEITELMKTVDQWGIGTEVSMSAEIPQAMVSNAQFAMVELSKNIEGVLDDNYDFVKGIVKALKGKENEQTDASVL